MPGSQLKEKLFNMFKSDARKTNKHRHTKKIKINKVKLTASRLKF